MIFVIPSSEAFSISLVESLADQVNEKLEMNPKLDWFLENEKSCDSKVIKSIYRIYRAYALFLSIVYCNSG